MVYVAFDMDGTLGNFMVLWAAVTGLLHSDGDREKNPLYIDFVRQMAIREKGSTPLGIFRPGIFNVMRRMAKLKKAGAIAGVIIYTNNGSLELAEFVRDVIHRVLRYKLFDDTIHFYHTLRFRGSDGKGPSQKTWLELAHLLRAGEVKAPNSIRPSDVLFVDDQNHADLVAQLGENYVRVPEYRYEASISSVIDMIGSAITEQFSGTGTDLFRYTGFHGSIERYTGYLRREVSTTASLSAVPTVVADRGSSLMIKALRGVDSSCAGRRPRQAGTRRAGNR